jgi:hypothetical protein
MTKKNILSEDKKPLTVSFKNIVIQISVIVFFTITWLGGLIFSIGVFNVWYFLFMFGGVIISGLLTLYSKANPDQPIPKKPTQQFTNLVKVMTDIITNFVGAQSAGIVEIKDIIQKALVWSLREAKISPEFDRKTLEEAETYIFDKLFPKKEGETESAPTG